MDSQKNTINNDRKPEEVWWQPALIMFARLSVWIVAPVVVGTYVGNALDRKFESEPIFLMGVVGFSFLVSMFGLVKETTKEYKKIEKENDKK